MAKKSSKKRKITQEQNMKNVLAIFLDFVVVFLLVSVFHFILIKMLGISPTVLLRRGIETALFEQKMQIIAYLGFSYIAFIVAYLVFLRKYYSLGRKIFKK